MAVTVKPVVHLNGTPKEQLLEQVRDAMSGIDLARTALCIAAPNGRDYYPVGPTAFNEALRDHDDRQRKLREVYEDLEVIATHLLESGS